jgi:hypothetical protein
MQSSAENFRAISPMTQAEQDVAADVALPTLAKPLTHQRHSCPDFGAQPAAAPTASSFLNHTGNMYNPKTCSVAAGTRASLPAAGSTSGSLQRFKRQSANKLIDPMEEEFESTNILDFFEDVERTSKEEKWDWGALARGDTGGKNVLDLLNEHGHDESVIDHRNSQAQHEDELKG